MRSMKSFRKIYVLMASVIGGLMMSLAWPVNGIGLLLFVGIIPFLFVEDQIYRNSHRYSRFAVFFYTYVGFFIWNFLTTWWVYEASLFGAAMAVIFNSLFMALVFQLFHYCRKVIYRNHTNRTHGLGYFVLIIFWVSFEYLHLNWELSWPWLILGNGFASMIKSIQWYEFTGSLGGTFWVLIMNVLLYRLFQKIIEKQPFVLVRKFSLLPMFVLILPFLISVYMYYSYEEKSNPVDVVVVQPNIDPYNTKFFQEYFEDIWNILTDLSVEMADTNTNFIIWPETCIPGNVNMSEPQNHAVDRLKVMIAEHFPKAILIAGADGFEIYDTKATPTARLFQDGTCCWDSYNAALEVDSSGIRNHYYKTKLVPGVERMPYPQIFGFLEKFAIDLGGSTGSMATSPEPVVFTNGIVPVAPAICYESVYGDYLTGFVRNGAQLIFIITNDGWWGDSPGHKQHLQYASLRAIETRRSIARSANTGISCYINQRGDIIQAMPYWEKHVIRQTIHANDTITLYVRYGDYPGRIALFASIAVLLLVLVKRFSKRKITYQG